MNIMNMAMRYLGPVVANKAASMLGINNSIATKLIAAALPSIMASLVGKSSTGGGAGALFDLLKSSNVQSPTGFEAALNSPGAADMARSGGGMLTDLLGGNAMGALTKALGGYGGADEEQTKGLLGLVGPVALGSLQDQVSEQGLDAAGLASFLSDQKGNIAKSVPADFAPALQSSGFLGDFEMPDMAAMAGSVTGAATEKASEMAEAAAEFVPEMSAPEMPKSGGMMKWIIGAVVLAGLGWFFLGNSTPEMPDISSVDMSVGDVNVGDQFTGVVDSITTTVGGITDGDTAAAAVPELEGINTKLDEITGLADQLPDVAKGPFQSIVGTAITTLKPLIDGAIESSGAGAILQPIADSMMEKLAGLAG